MFRDTNPLERNYQHPGHTELWHQNPFSMTKKEVEIEERRKTQALAGILTKAGEQSLKTESTVFPKH